ncbi:hypothetical protein HNQ51_000879 [Inhella inkyongensis]|uniref:DUF4188 domain-containing protein n=1 Tax=Inhella inkyongensis TaxID=392593 RepID=A0A840S3E8_9BURK|nr:DUF4188 domain-containing protein [Inhella inkyongensis]MBB5203586.1 hypothetical protein [Inhella inkyongensis]
MSAQPMRRCAQISGEFVVFLIGMRINRPLRVDRWAPVMAAMPRMLKELQAHPELGYLHGESWVGRTTLMLQYWRSLDQLMAYAKDRQAAHLPAWKAFNQRLGRDGAVGIWHETYVVTPGRFESVYVNMPDFGLGRAAACVEVGAGRATAMERMKATH